MVMMKWNGLSERNLGTTAKADQLIRDSKSVMDIQPRAELRVSKSATTAWLDDAHARTVEPSIMQVAACVTPQAIATLPATNDKIFFI